jgi:hypothetical protein
MRSLPGEPTSIGIGPQFEGGNPAHLDSSPNWRLSQRPLTPIRSCEDLQQTSRQEASSAIIRYLLPTVHQAPVALGGF